MKNAIILFLIFLLPICVLAKSGDYQSAVKQTSSYINSSNFSTRNKYLLLNGNLKFILDDNGRVSSSSSFTNGGMLNRSEYCLSTSSSNCKGSTYLIVPSPYWTLTSTSRGKYFIDTINGLNDTLESNLNDVRVTEFIKPQIIVSGSGTYSNPWIFDNFYLVSLKTNKKKLAYFGLESEKKTSEQKYATNECLKGNGYCVNFDITVERGYENDPIDGCNLKLIKKGEKIGTSTVKTYEISDIKKDINCVAIFNEDRFNIKFESNGGSGEMPDLLARYGHNIDLTNKFTREYYEFLGWNTAADGSGESWPAENIKFEDIEGERGIDENKTLTLYAQWKQKIIWAAVTTIPSGTLVTSITTMRENTPVWAPLILEDYSGNLYILKYRMLIASAHESRYYWDNFGAYKIYNAGEFKVLNATKTVFKTNGYAFSPSMSFYTYGLASNVKIESKTVIP